MNTIDRIEQTLDPKHGLELRLRNAVPGVRHLQAV
jgi:hypothetical protein